MTLAVRPLILLLAAVAALPPATAADASQAGYLSGRRIIVAPDAPPIEDGIIVLREGRIAAVGPRGAVAIPDGARELPCGQDGVIVAGFQNSHVHLFGPPFDRAAQQPAAAQSARLDEMFTRHGFTTVVDTGSNPFDTLALRARIESGTVRGPRIRTVGAPIYPPNGLPFYLAGLPKALLDRLPQPATPEAAIDVVRGNLDAGADGSKLFVATPQLGAPVRRMPAEVAQAAAAETHRRPGKLVMAHPTDLDGVRAALGAPVDVILHTTLGSEGPWPEALTRELVAKGVALVPTLKLWPYELAKAGVPAEGQRRLVGATQQQLKAFADAGGRVLFGTDVGYMADSDPADEYRLMAEAGLAPRQILAALTTAPAEAWREAAQRGRVAAGFEADLVVLAGDPLADARHLSNPRCTVRGGALLWPAP